MEQLQDSDGFAVPTVPVKKTVPSLGDTVKHAHGSKFRLSSPDRLVLPVSGASEAASGAQGTPNTKAAMSYLERHSLSDQFSHLLDSPSFKSMVVKKSFKEMNPSPAGTPKIPSVSWSRDAVWDDHDVDDLAVRIAAKLQDRADVLFMGMDQSTTHSSPPPNLGPHKLHVRPKPTTASDEGGGGGGGWWGWFSRSSEADQVDPVTQMEQLVHTTVSLFHGLNFLPFRPPSAKLVTEIAELMWASGHACDFYAHIGSSRSFPNPLYTLKACTLTHQLLLRGPPEVMRDGFNYITFFEKLQPSIVVSIFDCSDSEIKAVVPAVDYYTYFLCRKLFFHYQYPEYDSLYTLDFFFESLERMGATPAQQTQWSPVDGDVVLQLLQLQDLAIRVFHRLPSAGRPYSSDYVAPLVQDVHATYCAATHHMRLLATTMEHAVFKDLESKYRLQFDVVKHFCQEAKEWCTKVKDDYNESPTEFIFPTFPRVPPSFEDSSGPLTDMIQSPFRSRRDNVFWGASELFDFSEPCVSPLPLPAPYPLAVKGKGRLSPPTPGSPVSPPSGSGLPQKYLVINADHTDSGVTQKGVRSRRSLAQQLGDRSLM